MNTNTQATWDRYRLGEYRELLEAAGVAGPDDLDAALASDFVVAEDDDGPILHQDPPPPERTAADERADVLAYLRRRMEGKGPAWSAVGAMVREIELEMHVGAANTPKEKR